MAREVDILSAQAAVRRPGILKTCVAPALHLLRGGPSGSHVFDVNWTPSVGASGTSEMLVIRWDLASIVR